LNDPDGEQAVAVGGRLALAGGAAAIDGPLPIGDAVAVGVLIYTGAELLLGNNSQMGINPDGSLTTPGGNRVRNHGRRGNGGEYLAGKGHTPETVDEILGNPADSYPAAKGDTSTGGEVGATVNVGEGGDWAVVNDETGEVIQVNDRNNSRQPPPDRLEDRL
jgi:hypothetical protein